MKYTQNFRSIFVQVVTGLGGPLDPQILASLPPGFLAAAATHAHPSNAAAIAAAAAAASAGNAAAAAASGDDPAADRQKQLVVAAPGDGGSIGAMGALMSAAAARGLKMELQEGGAIALKLPPSRAPQVRVRLLLARRRRCFRAA